MFLRPELNYLNEEKIPDPTAYNAFSHKAENEGIEKDLKHLNIAMAEIDSILRRHCFRRLGYVKVVSKKTGRVFRGE